MIDDEQIAARIERLARETESILPRADFTARVMSAVQRERADDWASWVQKPARRFLSIAAMAAVLAVFWASESAELVEDELAVSYGTMEIEW